MGGRKRAGPPFLPGDSSVAAGPPGRQNRPDRAGTRSRLRGAGGWTILIIGGTRFVGYQLAWRLLAAGHRVTLLNRGTRPDPFGDRVERLVADRSTPEFCAGAGRADLRRRRRLRRLHRRRRPRRRRGPGRRTASATIYSSAPDRSTSSATDVPGPPARSTTTGRSMARPLDPADLDDWTYGVEKRRAEDVLVDAWDSTGFPSTRLRIPMVNGERDHYRRIESQEPSRASPELKGCAADPSFRLTPRTSAADVRGDRRRGRRRDHDLGRSRDRGRGRCHGRSRPEPDRLAVGGEDHAHPARGIERRDLGRARSPGCSGW